MSGYILDEYCFIDPKLFLEVIIPIHKVEKEKNETIDDDLPPLILITPPSSPSPPIQNNPDTI